MKTKLQPASADYKKLSDEELVHRYIHRQDQVAINFLFERYGHLVLGVCLNHLKSASAATEATQKIFIQLLEDLHRYKIEQFKPWLLQFTKNYCLLQNGGKIAVANNEFVTNQPIDTDADLLRKMEEAQLFDKLERAIEDLPAEQRKCIELFYVSKMTFAAIAAQTKFSLKEVKANLRKGIVDLKDKMEALADVK